MRPDKPRAHLRKYRVRRGLHLQAAPAAAVAPGTIFCHSDVSKLTRQTEPAAAGSTFDEQCRADSAAQKDAKEIAGTLCRSEAPGAKAHGNHAIFDDDRRPHASCAQCATEVIACPRSGPRRHARPAQDDPRPRFHEAMQPNADALD